MVQGMLHTVEVVDKLVVYQLPIHLKEEETKAVTSAIYEGI